MSILLDALRKSEKRQRRGEVPGLSTPETDLTSTAGNSTRKPWVVLATMMLVLASAAAWHYWPDAEESTPKMAQRTETPVGQAGGPGPKPARPGGKGREGSGPRSPVETLADSASPPGAKGGQQGKAKAGAKGKGKTKAKASANANGKGKGKAKANAKANGKGKAKAGAKGKGKAKAKANGKGKARANANGKAGPKAGGQAKAGAQAKRQAGAPSKSPDGAGQRAARTPAAAKSAGKPAGGGAAGPKKQAQKPGSQVIGYWELPAKARNQLPEMRITVLVYAERPEDRFLLMNGQRYGEGDSIADGLVLQEIRRDGAVMKYRLYRFLLEQG